MPSPQQQALALHSAKERLRLYGVEIWYDSKANNQAYKVKAIIAGVSNKKQLEDGGFLYEHDSICRVMRVVRGDNGLDAPLPFTPTLSDTIVYPPGSPPMRVNEVVNNILNPEWKLGLSAAI